MTVLESEPVPSDLKSSQLTTTPQRPTKPKNSKITVLIVLQSNTSAFKQKNQNKVKYLVAILPIDQMKGKSNNSQFTYKYRFIDNWSVAANNKFTCTF